MKLGYDSTEPFRVICDPSIEEIVYLLDSQRMFPVFAEIWSWEKRYGNMNCDMIPLALSGWTDYDPM
jgi:hypothetical protein